MAEKTASLTVLGGPFAGTRCVLPESGTVTIGSASDSTVHQRVSVTSGRRYTFTACTLTLPLAMEQ